MLELGQPKGAAAENNDTYLLVVDDGNNLDQLNSQTFYIDSNSLANGDLSNMVLTTAGPAAACAAASHRAPASRRQSHRQ